MWAKTSSLISNALTCRRRSALPWDLSPRWLLTFMLWAEDRLTDKLSLCPDVFFWSIGLSNFKLQLLLHMGIINKGIFMMSQNNFKALYKNLITKDRIGLVGGDMNWNSVGFVCGLLMIWTPSLEAELKCFLSKNLFFWIQRLQMSNAGTPDCWSPVSHNHSQPQTGA